MYIHVSSQILDEGKFGGVCKKTKNACASVNTIFLLHIFKGALSKRRFDLVAEEVNRFCRKI